MTYVFRAFLLLTGVFAVSPQASRAQELDLRMAMDQFPGHILPHFDTMLSNRIVAGFVFRPITATDSEGKLVCALCETVPTFENGLAVAKVDSSGENVIELNFTIREGLTWSDGLPVTSDDVRFSWEVGRHPDSPVVDRSFFMGMKDLTIISERQFRLTRRARGLDYNDLDEFYIFNKRLEEPIFRAEPAQFAQRTTYQRNPGQAGLYFGPYMIERVDFGRMIRLVRNPHWKGPRPAFPTISLIATDSPAATIASLRTQQINFVPSGHFIPTEMLQQAMPRMPGLRLIAVPALRMERMSFNVSQPQLQSPRVRRALLLALNRELILSRGLQGRYQAALNPFRQPPTTSQVQDLAEAARLLSEEGWTLVNGRLQDRDGKSLSVRIFTTSGNGDRMRVAQLAQSAWSQLGVNATIQLQIARTLFGQTLPRGDFDVEISTRYLAEEGNYIKTLFSAEQIPTAENEFLGHNWSRYRNPRVDEIGQSLMNEVDPRKRAELIAEFQAIYDRDVIEIPLYFGNHEVIAPKELELTVPASSSPLTIWVETWRLTNRR